MEGLAVLLLALVAIVNPTTAGVSPRDPNGDGIISTIFDQRQYPEKDGSFGYRFETENGIANRMAGRTGDNGGTIMSGEYSYLQPDGTTLRVQWTADENGYHPVVTIEGAEKVVKKRSQQTEIAKPTGRFSSRGRQLWAR